jgi:hypothetical protein
MHHRPGFGLEHLPDGATVTQISNLDPTQGCCFRIGPVLGIDPARGVIVAWSDLTCIRGATPPPS